MSTPILTPGKCTALAVLGGVGLTVVASTMTGGAATVAVGGILTWLASMGSGHVQSWLSSKLKNPPPNADEVFRNHHIRQLLAQALKATVEKLVPLAKEKLGGVSQTLIDSGRTLADRLEVLIDSPGGTLAELREFNVTAILTDYAAKQGKVELLSEKDWRQFIDEIPALKDLKPEERDLLISALLHDFGEALWNLVKRDAATDRQAFAAVELLYLSQILESVQTIAGTPPPDLAPIINRISVLLKEIDQKHMEYFQSILSGITALEGKFDVFLETYQKDRLKDETFQKQTTASLASLSSAVLNSDPVCRYLANLTRRYAIHNTFGLPAFEAPGQKQEADRIEDLFVQPTCTPGRTSPEAMEAALLEGKNPAVPLLPLLEKERRVVLLADPGMGKSTLVQWLVVALAAPVPSRKAARFGRAIPFPFLLRDIVPALGNDLSKWTWQAFMEAFLAHRAGGSSTDPALAAPLVNDAATLRTVLESSQAWFLLDGLDEIGDPKRRLALQKVIWEGFELYPNARWLITSRVIGYEDAIVHEQTLQPDHPSLVKMLGEPHTRKTVIVAPDNSMIWADDNEVVNYDWTWKRANLQTSPFNLSRAALHYLAPWDDSQQRDFSQHWFTQRLGGGKGAEMSRDFLMDVHAHASTRVLGRVPNLLLLMGLLYRYRAHLPNGRALVYQGISAAYLEGIHVARKIPHRTDKVTVPYTFAEKERLLAIIAMHMMKQRMVLSDQEEIDQSNVGEILASETDLAAWLGPEFHSKTDQEGARELQCFVQHIADSSGLLLPRAPGVFGFAHLSFQEYYAACYLKLEFERIVASRGRARRTASPTSVTLDPLREEDFEHWAALPVWREPLLFLVELLKGSEPFTAEIMAWLFPTLLAETPTVPEPIQAQRLLATLSIDPEAALALDERQSLWQLLCRAHVGNERAWDVTESIAPALFERSEHQAEVLSTLAAITLQLEVTILYLNGCTGVSDLSALQSLTGLRTLKLTGCTGVNDLTALQGLTSLQTLSISGCTGVSDLSALQSLTGLQTLSLSGCTGVSDLSALQSLTGLHTLYLSGCAGVRDLSALQSLTGLQWLNLTGCAGVSDLSALQSLTGLRTLKLTGCTGVCDLSALQGLAKLQQLYLTYCTGVSDLNPLQGLTSLHDLSLSGCTDVCDLSALQGLASLYWLDLRGCTGVRDLSALQDLTNLRSLDLTGCTSVKDRELQIAALEQALAGCVIVA